ncbi:MAG: tetratricopeptide repeat protein [Bryobacteraceae bacterium]|jgi:predicted Zn-dependent protease
MRRLLRSAPCLLALTLITGCGWSPFGSKEEYVRRGRRFAGEGKYADAALQYQKALQHDGRYGEAYLRYGQLEVRIGNMPDAINLLNQAAQLMPSSEEARIELGQVAISLYLGDPRRPRTLYEAATRASTELLARHPNSADGWRFKGYLSVADSRPKDAIECFRKSLASDPAQPEAATMLSQALLADHQGPEAEEVATGALATFKTYGPLYDLLYGYYMASGRPADAEGVLRSKISNNPGKTLFVIELASHYWTQKNTRQANETIRSLLAESSRYPDAVIEAGDFYRKIGNFDEAIRLYQKGSESNPKRGKEYLRRQAGIRLEQGRSEDAASLFDRIIKDDPDDTGARLSRADLRMATQKPEEMEKAIAEFADLLKKTPENNQIRYSLANAYRQTGHEAEARSSLLEILKRDPGARNALREMADIAIRANRPGEALQYAERLLELDPRNSGARLVRTAAWALQGRLAEARSELQRLTTENPSSAEAWLQTAELNIETRNYSEAAKILDRLYQPGKGDLRALKALAVMYSRLGQPRKALDLVRAEVKRAAAPEVRILLATSAAQAGEPDLALATALKLASDFPRNPDHRIFIAAIYRGKGQLDRAIESLEKARALAPDNAAIGANLGETLAEAGQTDGAIAVYRQSLKIRPGDPLLLNGLAWCLASAAKNLDEAADSEKQALQKDPGNPAFLDTSGVILLRSGKLDDAFNTFQQLVHRDSKNPVYRTHLAAVLIERGERRKARVELETALRDAPPGAVAEEIRRLLRET